MLDSFRNRMIRQGFGQADIYRHNADMIMNETFTRDPAYKTVFVTHAPSRMNRKKYDAKFYIDTRRSISGDSENYTLMFRPHIRIPIGSYVDITDDRGKMQRWLVILQDDQPQFPVYYILKCNWVLKWYVDGKAYKCECVQRTQSSYNSGLWTDYTFTTVENQTIMFLPTTPYTQTLNYEQRVLVNDSGRAVPLAYHVSKVMDTIPVGLTRLTFAQVQTDLHEDCPKYGLAGWCQCSDQIATKAEICKACTVQEPVYIDAGLEMPKPEAPIGKITYNGKDATIRVGGVAKTFTAYFWDEETQSYINQKPYWTLSLLDESGILCSVDMDYDNGWNVNLAVGCPENIVLHVDGGDITCLSSGKDIFKIQASIDKIDAHVIKLKCSQLYSMVGKSIRIVAQNSAGKYTTELDVEVIS
nr:MAG TPA: head closure knob [Caudoviricetes sp.]